MRRLAASLATLALAGSLLAAVSAPAQADGLPDVTVSVPAQTVLVNNYLPYTYGAKFHFTVGGADYAANPSNFKIEFRFDYGKNGFGEAQSLVKDESSPIVVGDNTATISHQNKNPAAGMGSYTVVALVTDFALNANAPVLEFTAGTVNLKSGAIRYWVDNAGLNISTLNGAQDLKPNNKVVVWRKAKGAKTFRKFEVLKLGYVKVHEALEAGVHYRKYAKGDRIYLTWAGSTLTAKLKTKVLTYSKRNGFSAPVTTIGK